MTTSEHASESHHSDFSGPSHEELAGLVEPPDDGTIDLSDRPPQPPAEFRDIPHAEAEEPAPTDEETIDRLAEDLEAAGVDAVTGLLNKQAYIKAIESRYGLSLTEPAGPHDHERRHELPKRVVMIYADVCDLKAINTHFGHQGGDDALKRSAEKLAGLTRSSDILARVGGDELAIVMTVPDDVPDAELDQFRQDRLAKFTESELAAPRPRPVAGYAELTDMPDVVAFGSAVGVLRPYTPAERQAMGPDAPVSTFSELYAKADEEMYRHKTALKGEDSAEQSV